VDKYRVGEVGVEGTRFGTHLEVTVRGKKRKAHPEMVLGGEMKRAPIKGAGVAIELSGLDAADGRATLQLITPELVIPVQLYFKPLTSLVWLGAGMMTLGGFLSILKRRKHAAA
jgi:LPXTG-motif cell wall-anchored protein